MDSQWFVSFAVAVGLGLLIGLERERRMAGAAQRGSAGIRTFAIASLAGLGAMSAGGLVALIAVALAAAALVAIAYWRGPQDDRGLTTEITLILTVFLGGLSLQHPQQAAALGIGTAILLAAKGWLHRFASVTLSETELRDGLLLAAATFIVLPLLPDHPIDPLGALNPRSIWTTAVLVMAISAAGYVAERVIGPRYGLAAAGFASGFVSSTATIGAMGARTRADGSLLFPASVGAILSTVATVVQMAIILGATSLPTLLVLAPTLLAAGAAAILYAIGFAFFGRRSAPETAPATRGRAFSFRTALIFALTLGLVLVATAFIVEQFGSTGVAVGTALAGLVDAHSPAIAVATLVSTGKLVAAQAAIPVLLCLSTNTISKSVFAMVSGGPRFAACVLPGLALVVAAAWLGLMLPLPWSSAP